MAKKIQFKEFLIIEATAQELKKAFGSPGICDFCGRRSSNGYYIAVLNRWFCPECFEEWKEQAIFYPCDRPIEEKNYRFYSTLLNVKV